jgi:hypothetical protein
MHIARPFTRTAAWTRPSDTTQYTAGDGVSDATTTATAATFVLPNMGAMAGMGGVIRSLTLHKSDDDLTGADFDVYFFKAQPVATGWDDNAAIAITDAEWANCLGFVSFVGSTDGRSVQNGNIYCKSNLDLPYECGTDTTTVVAPLYFVVVARGTYTPASAEVFTLTVGAVIQ